MGHLSHALPRHKSKFVENPVFFSAAAWHVNFPSVAHGRQTIRGRSSVMPRPEKTQDVSVPYVYFSVGSASAMGSGRVGGSSYPFCHLYVAQSHTAVL